MPTRSLNSHGKTARRAAAAFALIVALVISGCAVTEPATDVGDTAATLTRSDRTGREADDLLVSVRPHHVVRHHHRAARRRVRHRGQARKRAHHRPQPGHALPLPGLLLERDGQRAAVATSRFRTGSPGMLPGFQETTAFSGLVNPTALSFSPDGRVFVAEKSGLIKVFDGLGDTTATTFADLRTQVHNFWDRGLLGLALDPDFPAKPFVYVLYTHDAAIGGTAPRWGTPGATATAVRRRPGPTQNGCVVSGRRVPAPGRRQPGGRRRAGADRGLVPAVPEPLGRGPRVRRRRRAVRERRGRGELQLRRLRADRQPVRRSTGGAGRHPGAARARRAVPCAARTCAPPATRRAWAARSCASIPIPGTGCPPTRWRDATTPTPAASSPTACAIRSASPSGPAPASPGSATSAGTTGRRSTAWPTDLRRHAGELRLALLRGTPAPRRVRQRGPQPLREPVRERALSTSPLLHL